MNGSEATRRFSASPQTKDPLAFRLIYIASSYVQHCVPTSIPAALYPYKAQRFIQFVAVMFTLSAGTLYGKTRIVSTAFS